MRSGLPLLLGALPLACSNDIKIDPAVNTAPVVAFQAPVDQALFDELDTIDFVGSVADVNGLDDVQSWTFSSDRDGLLGDGAEVPPDGFVRTSRTLSVGTHSVTLTAIDLEGALAADAITVIVAEADQLPNAEIVVPTDQASFELGTDVQFFGTVNDPNESPDELAVVWTVEPALGGTVAEIFSGFAEPSGATDASWHPDARGQFRVQLVVTDADGNEAVDAILFNVIDTDEIDHDLDGWSVVQGDCNDFNDLVHPEADEVCDNATDDDCNGFVDDKDADLDQHVDDACVESNDGPKPADDCDDSDPTVHPGGTEVLDGADNDCDGRFDEDTDAWDMDGDCVCVAAACTGSENPLCDVASLAGNDCDDEDPNNFPFNVEVCDHADNDCDNVDDNGIPLDPYWPDADGDGYGSDSSLPQRACDGAPANHVPNNDDCDDGEFDVNPSVIEVWCDGIDNDCSLATTDGPDNDGDGSPFCFDCDDNDPNNAPGRPELCDDADNDCSGVADDGIVFLSYWPDADLDGFGDGSQMEQIDCAPPSGTVDNDDDCDDADDLVNPDATEVVCDGIENDCDLVTEDQPDLDGDGSSVCVDCNDGDADNFPGNVEACDNADNDCNGADDDGITFRDFWPDADGDGHGDPNGAAINDCARPVGYVPVGDDCDDGDPDNFPGNPEVCDNADNDCVGGPDDGLLFVSWYPDVDGDSYGNAVAAPAITCDGPPLGIPRVANNGDCNDVRADVNPAAVEVTCDGVDNDCLAATEDEPDEDVDGVPVCDDCDDGDPENFPGNAEACDGADNDCNGAPDNGLTFANHWLDNDGDGFGTPLLPPESTCDGAPPGRVDNDDDCNDVDSSVNPDATEDTCDGVDNDCSAATPDQPDLDGDGSSACVDCDDADPLNKPGGGEICDGRDNDCSGVADNGLTFLPYWPDADHDTFGSSAAASIQTCNGAPGGFVSNALDCDDADGANFPTNLEVCDGRDNDCNGLPDNGLVFTAYYPDNDSDGFGSSQVAATSTCDGPPSAGYTQDHADCNDASGTIHPGAAEVTADAIDQDCDGADDCWFDSDDDGVGVAVAVGGTTVGCTGVMESPRSDDCDDADPLNWPGNVELCDGRDNNCSGVPDENQVFVNYYPDADGDGFGAAGSTAVSTCTGPPAGHVANQGDCDDARPLVHPGATELTCNALNDDCDAGTLDAPDGDGDGSSVCNDCDDSNRNNFPGNGEVCDGADNDCDSQADDGLVFVQTWPDVDADGWGDGTEPMTSSCSGIPAGRTDNDLDCDDSDADLNQDDLDADGWSTCDGDCDDLRFATHPTAADVPDASFIDDNCDGIDGTQSNAVFVAINGSDVNNLLCSKTQPCRTIGYAQSIGAGLGLFEVYLKTGTYNGGVLLQNNMKLYGGYDVNWARAANTSSGHTVTLQGGFVSGDSEYITIRARNVTAGLYDLQIDGPTAANTLFGTKDGRSSYAIHAESSTLTLERLDVHQGPGAVGLAGTAGANATTTAPTTALGGIGASGGNFVCDTNRPNGGGAGTNSSCSLTGGGNGGAGGTSDTTCCNGTCSALCGNCNDKAGLAGQDGSQGATNGPGDGGAGGALCIDGLNGRDGLVSNGAGGGGGAGGNVYAFYTYGSTLTRTGTTATGGTGGRSGAGGQSAVAWIDGNDGTSGATGLVGNTATCANPSGC